ncbi:MAG TPA: DUF998 domain-containing protein [Microlunatus sp.]|nr:DUF998 domain-containing protein [Microlunatus sp.]
MVVVHRWRAWAGLAGAVGGLWFLGFSLILGLARPGYDPSHDAISRLGEQGSAMPILWNVGGFGVMAACYAVYATAIGSEFARGWFFWATVLQAVSIAGSGVFSCDLGCPAASTSTSGQLHEVFGLSYFAVTCLLPLVAGLTFRRVARWRVAAPVSYVIGVVLVALFLVGPFLFGAAHIGLWQRLVLVPALGWQVGISVRLHRVQLKRLAANAPQPATDRAGSRLP